MRIVFLGTPEFAVESLKAILHSKHEVVGVVTAPDAMGGRGRSQLIESDVKKYAVANGLKVLQPEKLKNKKFIHELKALHADIQVVVAFRMLPEMVWNMPPLGTINVHGSLLPKYRGAAPIHWAIIQGEKETGVTIFRLKHEIDTGDIIARATLPIEENETTGELYEKMMKLGATTLIQALDQIEAGTSSYETQDDAVASPAPKLFHENCEIQFTKSAVEIHNLVRGTNPKPTAWMKWNGVKYFIHKTVVSDNSIDGYIGSLVKKEKKLYLITREGTLEILEIQSEGKRKMSGEEFARGMR